MKLLLKINKKLILTTSIIAVSTLALLVLSSPILAMHAIAQGQNQTSVSPTEAEKKLTEIAQKFRERVTNAKANLTLPQGGNITSQLMALNASAPFHDLAQKVSTLPQELGLNTTGKNLEREPGAVLTKLAQKLENLTRGNSCFNATGAC